VPAPVNCDPDQLQQVFVNLGINALDAMRVGGGTLTITVRSEPDAVARVQVIFHDTGPGIPEQHRGRIFDPFFTTKDSGEGTGMGLAVSQTIIQSRDGETTVESGPGGTRFFVSLPLSQRPFFERIEATGSNHHAQ